MADHIGHRLTGDIEDTIDPNGIEEKIGTFLQFQIGVN
jgi:hypothetical protein